MLPGWSELIGISKRGRGPLCNGTDHQNGMLVTGGEFLVHVNFVECAGELGLWRY